MIKFTKMQGTGNDYIFINTLRQDIGKPGACAARMCKRQFGIGADGLILICKSEIADFKMRIFNADGSEAEMCGNGIRCFGKYVFEHGLTKKEEMNIETLAGIKKVTLTVKNEKVNPVLVDMGEPVLLREKIPMIGKPGMVINENLPLDDGTKFEITAVSMGNPHVIIFVEDIDRFPVEKYGPLIENHSLFPQRTNVEFVKVLSNREAVQRTWERGSGETLSCGTGAAAVTAACILNKKTGGRITIKLKGGILKTEWDEKDNRIYLSGPAEEVFEGTWEE